MVVAEAVALFFSDHLGHSEIAAADEDHITKMGVVDGGTIGVVHGLKYLSAQAHVKGFLG